MVSTRGQRARAEIFSQSEHGFQNDDSERAYKLPGRKRWPTSKVEA